MTLLSDIAITKAEAKSIHIRGKRHTKENKLENTVQRILNQSHKVAGFVQELQESYVSIELDFLF